MNSKRMEWRCPVCGSCLFGSSTGTGHVLRHCHGLIGGAPCRFSAPEADDWKHFHGVSRTFFKTKEEYEVYLSETQLTGSGQHAK